MVERKRFRWSYMGFQQFINTYLVILGFEGLLVFREIPDAHHGAGSRSCIQITPKGRAFYQKWKEYGNRILEKYPFITFKREEGGG